METHDKIELTTSTIFDLSKAESKRLYTALALFQYQFERTPNYNEKAIIRRLHNDFQKFNQELIKISAKDPNNLVVSKIHNFFERHYSYIKHVVKEYDE